MKVVKEILACSITALMIVLVIRLFMFDALGITYLQVGETTCCGLESGSIVLFKGFNPETLKRGEIILFNNLQTGQIGFSHVIAFPGEGLFQDLYAGKWGYAEKVELERTETTNITEEEISNLFSQITWLDSPTFQPTILSENLYDRLIYLHEDEQKYRTANDIDPKLPYTGAAETEQILGVYGLTLASANRIWLLYLAILAIVSVLTWAFLVFLPRIFTKLIKNKPAQPPPSQP